jgi:hypothetical protein
VVSSPADCWRTSRGVNVAQGRLAPAQKVAASSRPLISCSVLLTFDKLQKTRFFQESENRPYILPTLVHVDGDAIARRFLTGALYC